RQVACAQPPRGQRRRGAGDHAEDPEQGQQADEQRHHHEEAGDEPPPQPAHHACIHPAATAARIPEPSAIRYQPNGANPDRRTKYRNGRMTSSDEMNAITSPTAISRPRTVDRLCRTPSRSCANPPATVVTAKK